jgi:hypothetical protein
MVQHGPRQAPQQFLGRPAAGGFPLQQIGQPVQSGQLPARGSRLRYPVGVQQHHVIRLKFLDARLGGAVTEPEQQHRVTAEFGDPRLRGRLDNLGLVIVEAFFDLPPSQ